MKELNLKIIHKTFLYAFLLLIAIIVGSGFITGCSSSGVSNMPGEGGTEFSPPAPPVQIPQTFSLPKDPFIELDTIQIESAAAGTISLALGADGEFSKAIESGLQFADIPIVLIEGFLNDFSIFDIPVSPTLKTFETEFVEQFNGQVSQVKMDFSKADIDGDGMVEECAGCTCPGGCDLAECPDELFLDEIQSICYRLWEKKEGSGSYERGISGEIFLFPEQDLENDEELNAGNGRIFISVFKGIGTFPNETLFVEANYTDRNPSEPFNKFSQVKLFSELIKSPDTIDESSRFNISFEQIGLDGVEDNNDKLEKTVKVSLFGEFDESGDILSVSYRYIGTFRDDANFWFGSVVGEGAVGDEDDFDVQDQCVELSPGNAADFILCQDLQILNSQDDFLDDLEASFVDGDFLNDFPKTPTF